MKKILSCLCLMLLALGLTSHLSALAGEDLSLNVRVAYFHPESNRVKRIYSNGWADYQIEVASSLGCNWQLWSGVSYFSKKGHSIGLHDSTRLRLLPTSLGLKYLYCIAPNTQMYIGAGACYSFLRIKDHSRYVHEHIRKEAFGGIAQVGLYYYFNSCFFVNVFADYYFQRFDFSKHHGRSSSNYSSSSSSYVERNDLNLSGYKTGAGIGVNF